VKILKKIINVFLVIAVAVFIISAIACGSGTDDKAKKVSDTSASSATNEKVKDIYKINESVQLKGNVLVITKVEKSKGVEFEKPKSGNEFVIVTLKLTNKNKDKISYNPLDFKLQNSKGNIVDTMFSSVNQDTRLNAGELAANGEVTGTISYEAPIGDKKLTLEYKPSFWSDQTIKVSLN
jgi:hypothetical protein